MYDSVDCGFLESILIEFRFSDKIVNLIMMCISSSSLSLIWNGAHLESFQPTKGLRQGDPMSPYLFALCMEKLLMMIVDKVDRGD